jgi:cytochrome c553
VGGVLNAWCKWQLGIVKSIRLAIVGAILAGLAPTAIAQDSAAIQKAAEEKATNLCSTCHGPRGISTSPEFPILAAQNRVYLENQIEAFRKRTRSEKDAHDFMWGIAATLDDSIVDGIARYYAAQPASPGRNEDPALAAKGKDLFDKGLPTRGIPACATCHGVNGEGSTDFPRLAGQHSKYVVKQLTYIQSLVRAAPVMHGIVKDLTPAEIAAVAAYVQSK